MVDRLKIVCADLAAALVTLMDYTGLHISDGPVYTKARRALDNFTEFSEPEAANLCKVNADLLVALKGLVEQISTGEKPRTDMACEVINRATQD